MFTTQTDLDNAFRVAMLISPGWLDEYDFTKLRPPLFALYHQLRRNGRYDQASQLTDRFGAEITQTPPAKKEPAPWSPTEPAGSWVRTVATTAGRAELLAVVEEFLRLPERG